MIGNIQAATGVRTTVRDRKMFQGEVEGKRSGTMSRMESRKASSAREGEGGCSARESGSG